MVLAKKLEVVIKVLVKKKVMERKVKKFVSKFSSRKWSPSSLNKLLIIIPLLRTANPAVVKTLRRLCPVYAKQRFKTLKHSIKNK